MHLKQLSLRNIRGVSLDLNIGKSHIILGDNFAGKTGILHAVRMAVFGWIPHPRKDATIKAATLASGSVASIDAVFSDNSTRTFGWANGKLSQQFPAAIVPMAPDVLLDPKGYLDASAAKRIEYIMQNAKVESSKFSKDSILAQIKGIKLGNHDEQAEKAVMDIYTEIPWTAAPSIQEQIVACSQWLSDRTKLARQNVDRMAKTAAGISQVASDEVESVEELTGQIAEKRSTLAGVNSKLGAVTAEIAAAEKAETERRKLQGDLSRNQELLSKLVVPEIKPVDDDGVRAAEQALAVAESAAAVARKAHSDLKGEYATMAARNTAAAESFEKLRLDLVKQQDDADAALAHQECPFCHATGTDFHDRIVAHHRELVRAADEAAKKAEMDVQHVAQTVNQIGNQVAVAQSKMTEADAEMLRCKKQHANANAAMMVDVRARENALKIQNERAMVDQSIEVTSARLNALAETPNVSSKTAEKDSLLATKAELESVLRQMEARKTRAATIASERVTAAKVEKERLFADRALEASKAAEMIMKGVRQEMMDTVFGGLMSTINSFTAGILKKEMVYHEGDIGYISDGGQFVSQEQFSDTEQIVAHAAIVVALAQSSPYKLVIIDELTRVRGDRKRQIVSRLTTLVETGVIDQFIGVDTTTDSGAVPGYYDTIDNLSVTVI